MARLRLCLAMIMTIALLTGCAGDEAGSTAKGGAGGASGNAGRGGTSAGTGGSTSTGGTIGAGVGGVGGIPTGGTAGAAMGGTAGVSAGGGGTSTGHGGGTTATGRGGTSAAGQGGTSAAGQGGTASTGRGGASAGGRGGAAAGAGGTTAGGAGGNATGGGGGAVTAGRGGAAATGGRGGSSGGNGGAATAGSGGAATGGAGGTGGTAVSPPPAPTATGKHWDLVFAEEFNGASYDPTKLTPCFDWNSGDCTASFNSGRERYMPSQVQVSGGTAKLIAEPLSPPYASSACYQGQCTYKAGLLSTARPNAGNGSSYLFPFTYGYVESRMKFPAVKGMFTAFWMLPTDPTYNYRSEIDIVEILGYDPTTIWMHYHYNDRSQSYSPNSGIGDNGACAVKDYSRDFVRFGVDWEPTSVAFYIDGVKCGEYTGTTSTVESGPMQLILHMMVDNSWERDWSETLDSLTTVAQLEVDYIRIFQQH
jgi:hypothetical protein